MKNNFGVNHVHLNYEEIKKLKIRRIEICITASEPYEDALKKALKIIKFCEKEGIIYSIHLPLFIYEGYDEDYLSAFFISSNKIKRKKSFRLLKENVDQLKSFNPDFLVLHFPGITEDYGIEEYFNKRLKDALNRVNDLAKVAGCKILLEYFGSNVQFSDYKKWVEILKGYSNLGLLVDLGHLYFASINRSFDFYEALKYLAPQADAFHLWSVYGQASYQKNTSYLKYHHIAPRLIHNEDAGWGFNMKKALSIIKETGKPAIMEASDLYKGHDHFIDSISMLQKYFSFSK